MSLMMSYIEVLDEMLFGGHPKYWDYWIPFVMHPAHIIQLAASFYFSGKIKTALHLKIKSSLDI